MQHEILGEVEVEHEPAALPVLGNVAQTGVEGLASARAAEFLTADADAARHGMAQPGQGVDQLRLPVAVDPCDPDDLPGAHLERDTADGLQPAVVAHDDVLQLQQRLAWL